VAPPASPPVVSPGGAGNPPSHVCPPGTFPAPPTGAGAGGTLPGGTGTGGTGTTGTTGGSGMAPPECLRPSTSSTEASAPPAAPAVVAGETARRVAPSPAAEVVAGVSERLAVEAIQLPRTGGPGPLMLVEVALGGLGLAALGRRLRRR
jgi:hypothetical protein